MRKSQKGDGVTFYQSLVGAQESTSSLYSFMVSPRILPEELLVLGCFIVALHHQREKWRLTPPLIVNPPTVWNKAIPVGVDSNLFILEMFKYRFSPPE